ncbi:AsmA-like C-terminal region-containing protein [Hymenobacter glacieicola]|uniref:AsmA-like C-terminal domain-containing protein n=1 Tax=Hymenobacter glacieicola TaxID=1562124 RepID=A0ABQ1WT01_9BACT|nr:AsmA-like C-terminal region-containing protein [Hymenobacter glacieicola]GGG41798.1 hypothetical protein GCM10011378_17640 [Hymenobacter glacieicola]
MKRPSIRQFLVLAVLGLLVAVVAGTWLLGTRWGQRRLEQAIRQRLAQQSDLVVAPFRVDFSVWRNFPHLTASVHHLSLTDTSYHRAVPVLRIERADMRVELQQIWRGSIRISHVTLQNGTFQQFTDSLGHDWGLRGKGPRRVTPAGPPDFNLDSLVLRNVRVTDRNELHHSGFAAYVRQGRLTVRSRGGVAQARGRLDGQLVYLRSGRGNLFTQEPVVALVRYRYDFRRREGTFLRTHATLNGDTILVTGTHRGAAPGEPRGTRLNLRFQGTQPLLEVLHVALPSGLQRYLQGARSRSHARIWYTIRGISGPTTRPRTILRFALRGAQVQWADAARRIQRWDARGIFDNGPQHSPRTTYLTFTQCRLYSRAGQLEAALTVRDFTRPHLLGRVRGRTELQTLAAVVAPRLWRARGGQAALDLQLNGAVPEIPDRLARRTTRPDTLLPILAAHGTVRLEQAAFTVPGRQAAMTGLNVLVRLHDSRWILENLTGRLNGMQVRANATTTYLLAYFSGQRAATTITGSFGVDELHLHELRRLLAPPGRSFRSGRTPRPGRSRKPQLAARVLNFLPPGLHLNVRLQCGRLVVGTDTLQQLAATVRHDGRRVQLTDLRGHMWGGTIRGVISWPTDTLTPPPVAAQLAVHFRTLRYRQLLARLTRPPRRSATAPAAPTLREVLLAANGQALITIDRLLLPGPEQFTNLRLRVDKNGPRFLIPALTFTIGTGGTGRVSASALLAGTRLAQARTDIDLRYASLNVQHLLQMLASLSTLPSTSPEQVRPAAARGRLRPSPFLDGTITGRVRVTAAQMTYGALRGQHFRLLSNLKAGQVQVEECAVQALDGSLHLRGTLRTDAGTATRPLHAQLRLRDIQLPKLFELAHLLRFDVVGPDNIRGSMRCEADVHTELGPTFLPLLSQTRAFLRTDLRDLEMIEVEAVTQALKLLREKRTGHLYFEPVQPRFVLEGSRLLIPALSLSSNLTDMTVTGEYYLTGQADLYVGLSPLQALFGDNKKRISRIQSGEAEQRPSRGLVYMNLYRQPGSPYKVRPFRKQEQQRQQALIQRQYRELLQRQPLDTTLRLLQ